MPNTESLNSGAINAPPPFANSGRLTITAPASLTIDLLPGRLVEVEIPAAAQLTVVPTIHPYALPLPAETVWEDERAWNAVQRSMTRTLNGNLIIQKQFKNAGRPMRLNCGWLKLSTLTRLEAWRDNAEVDFMTVILPDGRVFQTQWQDVAAPIVAVPVIEMTTYEDDDNFAVTLYLLTV